MSKQREIKFRGKRVDNGEWVYGYYVRARNHVSFKETAFIVIPDILDGDCHYGYTDSPSEMYFHDYHEVDPETVGQWTGLKDNNGKEIYEGDILYYPNEEMIISIRWDQTGGCWEFDEQGTFDDGVGRGEWRFNMGIAKNSTVIGNIYENGDLVGKESR